MAWRFPRCRDAIVATGAGAAAQVAMFETRGNPSTRHMTVVANFARPNMAEIFSGRLYAVMTFAAKGGRALELATQVARFALHGFVRAGQWESGTEVIELELLGLRGFHRQGSRNCRAQRDNRKHPHCDISESRQEECAGSVFQCFLHFFARPHWFNRISLNELVVWHRSQRWPKRPRCSSSPP